MTNSLSAKITIASFVATIMVVYRHSLNYLAFFGTWTADGMNGWVQDSIMRLTEIAVPYFFLVSGFFFFRTSYYTIEKYVGMLKKKWWGLAIPFLIWNVVGALVLVVSDRSNVGETFIDGIRNLLMSEWYGPLWYVRDLIVLMVCVPIYGWLLNVAKWYKTIPLIVIIGIFMYMWVPVDNGFISLEGVLFFLLGGILQRFNKAVEWRMPIWAIVIFSALWSLQSFLGYAGTVGHKFNTIIGIVVFWHFLDFLSIDNKKYLMRYASYSFLIYVLHFYVIKVMKVMLGRMFYGNEIVSLAAYLILPLITIVLIVIFGQIFKKSLPNMYKVSMGGR